MYGRGNPRAAPPRRSKRQGSHTFCLASFCLASCISSNLISHIVHIHNPSAGTFVEVKGKKVAVILSRCRPSVLAERHMNIQNPIAANMNIQKLMNVNMNMNISTSAITPHTLHEYLFQSVLDQ
jgi:hypothetical protein